MAPLEQFILFGDSITEGGFDQLRGFGFAAELANAYNRRLDVINRGYSGYNTDHALQVLPHVFPTPEQASVKFLTIWFGANDANKEPLNNQHVPLERFKANLRTTINSQEIKSHSPNIILITNAPFEETVLEQLRDEWGFTGEVRKAIDGKEYADAVKELGKELGVPVLDVWGLFMGKAGWKEGDSVLPGSKAAGKSQALSELLNDGLHLSGEGYRVVFDGLIKVLKENWAEYPPYKMPFAVKVPWEIELGSEYWDVKNDK